MKISFYKYEGTGNDFILIDNRNQNFKFDSIDLIKKLCHRKWGIGADGLILIQKDKEVDFEMIYFNSDGSQSLCGNGSRCAIHFANHLGMIKDKTIFRAFDGIHEGYIRGNAIYFKMKDVESITQEDDGHFEMNTGSPHYITFVEDVNQIDVVGVGRKIRNSYQDGINVNFVQKKEDCIFVRTYERGVEDETFSCGTGVTACALVMGELGSKSPVIIHTRGGELKVEFKKVNNSFQEIYLIGPAQLVFTGEFIV
jgi:diaminopimelate epimerase